MRMRWRATACTMATTCHYTPMSKPIVSCACGASYSAPAWFRLPLVGTQPDGDGGVLELRNCLCGSTRSVLVEDVADTEPAPPVRQCDECGAAIEDDRMHCRQCGAADIADPREAFYERCDAAYDAYKADRDLDAPR